MGNYYFPAYGQKTKGVTITEHPVELCPVISQNKDSLYTPISRASSFLEETLKEASIQGCEFDFVGAKTDRAKDRIGLILESIADQEMVKYQNLTSLYRDLLTVDKLIAERPILPHYQDDQAFFRLNENKLKLYDGIRKQLSDTAKANSFMTKELIDALLDHRKQTGKAQVMSDDGGAFLN